MAEVSRQNSKLDKLTPIFDFGPYSALSSVSKLRIGNIGIVSGRVELSTNSSGIKEINIELPWKFTGYVSLSDNAYGMNYMDTTSASIASPATILFSSISNIDGVYRISGHVNFQEQTSYNMYTFTAIGVISD